MSIFDSKPTTIKSQLIVFVMSCFLILVYLLQI